MFTRNYWEDSQGQRTPSATPSKRITVDDIARIRASGREPTEEEIAVALETFYDTGGDQVVQDQRNQFMSNATGGVQSPAATNDFENFARSFGGPHGGKSAPVVPNAVPVGSGMTGIGKGLMGGITGIAQEIVKAANQGGYDQQGGQQSLMDLYQQLQSQMGQPSYTGRSAEEMAREEFDPQFQMLAELAKQTEGRYSKGRQEIAGLYNALYNSTLSSRDAAANQAKQAATAQQQSFDNTAAGVRGNVDQSIANSSELLANLGVIEGQDKLANDAQGALTRQLGYLGNQHQSSADLANQLSTNRFAYDTERADINKQAGVNANENFLQAYLDRQNENDMQRLQLQGQRSSAENNYEMQIQQMMQAASADREDQLMKMMGFARDDRRDNMQSLFQQAGLDNDQARLGLEREKFQAEQGQRGVSAFDRMSDRALQMSGGDQNRASQATRIIMDAVRRNPAIKSTGELLREIDDQALNQFPELYALASLYASGQLK